MKTPLWATFIACVCCLVTANVSAENIHWEHGFMISDDGNDNPFNDPGCNERAAPTWYHVLGAFNWFTYSVDLTTVDPRPKYIHYIGWGGGGWDYEGYWDNLSFKIDGAEQVGDGSFASRLKYWPHDGGGRGQFLYDTVNYGVDHGYVFHYRRTASGADGGRNWVRLYVNQCLEDADSLVLSGDVYLINQALGNPGWWCCVYDCAPELGDYPGEIRVYYSTECPEDDEGQITLCHVPPGNPDNAHTIHVGPGAAESHLANHAYDYLGPCVEEDEGGSNFLELEVDGRSPDIQDLNRRDADQDSPTEPARGTRGGTRFTERSRR